MAGDPQQQNVYSASGAWVRACVYFALCLLASAYFGVLQRLFSEAVVTSSQLADPAWQVLTLAVSAQVVFGYFYFWPRGTVTHGRPRRLLAGTALGLLWGFCQGQLMLVTFDLIARAGLGPVASAGLMFVAWSVWAAIWQSRYWDVHIAPPHNIAAWNLRKVLAAHVPFLLLSVVHYALFANTLLFVAWQVVALTASALVMRFPAPGDKCRTGSALHR